MQCGLISLYYGDLARERYPERKSKIFTMVHNFYAWIKFKYNIGQESFNTVASRWDGSLWFSRPKALEKKHYCDGDTLSPGIICVFVQWIFMQCPRCQALYWVLGPRRTLSVWFAAVFSPRALDLWWKMRCIHFFQSSKNWLHRFLLNKQQVSETQVLEELATPSIR